MCRVVLVKDRIDGMVSEHANTNVHFLLPCLVSQPWQSVAAACALAMLLLNFHRSTFTMLVPLMANELHMGLAAVGGLQSAMLLGYLAVREFELFRTC